MKCGSERGSLSGFARTFVTGFIQIIARNRRAGQGAKPPPVRAPITAVVGLDPLGRKLRPGGSGMGEGCVGGVFSTVAEAAFDGAQACVPGGVQCRIGRAAAPRSGIVSAFGKGLTRRIVIDTNFL